MTENIFDSLPAEIKCLILNLLDVQDLLNLCLVSKSLNEFIGASHDCMQRIWVKFYTFKLKDLKSLSESQRQYEKLKINRVKLNEHFEFLCQLEMPWKKMLIYNCEFKHLTQLENILKTCHNTIKEIEFSDLQILNNEFDLLCLEYLELERVMFRNVPSTTIELLLHGKHKKLHTIAFDISPHEISNRPSLSEVTEKLLRNSENLNLLQLGPSYIKSLFDNEALNAKTFPFNLTKILLKFPIIPEESEIMERNLCDFIASQTKIDWIIHWELHSEKILLYTWKLPVISHVTFIGLECLFDDLMELNIEVNPNIRHLELLSRKVLLSQLKKFLISTPNLQILHIFILNKYALELIVRSHFNILEIRFEALEDDDVTEIYENLKRSNEEINRNIQLRQVSFWRDVSSPFLVDPKFWHS